MANNATTRKCHANTDGLVRMAVILDPVFGCMEDQLCEPQTADQPEFGNNDS